MAVRFTDTREWKIGDLAQTRWAKILDKAGWGVVPLYGVEGNTPETKAPMMMVEGGLVVAPDLLVFHGDEETSFCDVKAKSIPTWRRYTPGPRWEHGCDYSLAQAYRKMQELSGWAVRVIVHEIKSPVDTSCESLLLSSDRWLCIDISKAFDRGQRRHDWPGGTRGF